VREYCVSLRSIEHIAGKIGIFVIFITRLNSAQIRAKLFDVGGKIVGGSDADGLLTKRARNAETKGDAKGYLIESPECNST
jgi:hypothetical protein